MLSMANSGKDTNKSQFFVLFNQKKHLDNKYTVFGKLVKGFTVLDKIEESSPDELPQILTVKLGDNPYHIAKLLHNY